MEFPESIHLEIGKYVEYFIKWLIKYFGGFFDALSDGILGFLVSIQSFLLWIPWFIFLILIFLLGWKIKGIKSGLIYAVLLFLVGTLGLWEEMMLTLAVVLTAVIISAIIGVPIGIITAYNDKLDVFIKPLLDTMQTMPSFVYLIPAMMLFGLGMVPAVFATVIYATPPAIRLTNLAIKNVSREMIEAANSFGASPWQVLMKVELPQAFPTIMTGINQTTMMAMSMVVISSMIGAKGIGLDVLTAINRIDIKMGFEAGISIVFIAIIIDRLTQGIADKYKISD
ncbi:MAG: ABC transporter permease [Eubacteriales bacterium]